jgi:hypothetical protein
MSILRVPSMGQEGLERFSNSRGVTKVVQGGFFLRKKPLKVRGFLLHQLENRYIGFIGTTEVVPCYKATMR